MDRVLFNAITKGDWSTARWLAGQGRGINFVDIDGNTMLHLAAKWNQPGLVKLLLAKGAQVDAPNSVNQTPLFAAAYNRASAEVAMLLLDAGAQVNCPDKQGWTPLLAATYSSAGTEFVGILVQHGADRSKSLPGGKTALDFALEKTDVLEQATLVASLTLGSDAHDDTLLPSPSITISTIQQESQDVEPSLQEEPRKEAVLSESSRGDAPALEEVSNTSFSISECDVSEIESKEDDAATETTKQSTSKSSTVVVADETLSKAKVYISYNRATASKVEYESEQRTKVSRLVDKLREKGLNIYVDLAPSSVSQSKLFAASKELMTASVFVPCVTMDYMHRVFVGNLDAATLDICAQEFSEATQRLPEQCVVPIILDRELLDGHVWKGPVGLLLYNTPKEKTIDYTGDAADLAADGLVETIRKALLSSI